MTEIDVALVKQIFDGVDVIIVCIEIPDENGRKVGHGVSFVDGDGE